jgi:chemotaxis protein MotB
MVCLALSVGCGIKKSVHQKALNDLQACQGKLAGVESKRDQAESQVQELSAELRSLKGDTATLSKANREAAGRITKMSKEMAATEAELRELRKQRAAAEKRLKAYRDLQDKLRALTRAGKLKVNFRKGQMVIELPSGVLFASGKATLSRNGEAALAEILEALKSLKGSRLMIAGHTDNVPIKSRKFKNNWALSTARAVSVLNFMVDAGFKPENMTAAGNGEFDPVASNETKAGRAQNRRIELILLPDLSELPKMTEDNS